MSSAAGPRAAAWKRRGYSMVIGWRWFRIMAAAALASGLGAAAAFAEEAAGPTYGVTYIEAMPKAEGQVANLLKKQALEIRKNPASLGYFALQRDMPGRHFAVVEIWKDRAALDAQRGDEREKQFRTALEPLLAVPLDERPHKAMLVDLPRMQAALQGLGRDTVAVLTHVDVIPTKLEEGLAATKATFEPSSAEPGNVSYQILQHSSRANHMTLF